MKNLLFIVDPQNDFTDPRGSLYVPGAEKTIEHICKFIKTHIQEIDEILISADTHQYYNVGFAEFWNIPGLKAFDKISVEDILSGKCKPRNLDPQKKDAFLSQFRKYRGKELTIWPRHCIEGTWGCCFPDSLNYALGEWGLQKSKGYKVFKKGYVPEIESYSVFPSVLYIGNGEKLERPRTLLQPWNSIWIAGFCKDICVAETLQDMKYELYRNKLILLENCMATLNPSDPRLSIYQELTDSWGAKIEMS